MYRVLFVAALVSAALFFEPTAASAQLKLSVGHADKDDLDVQLRRNIRCISDTIYTEARGELPYAQALMAYVVVSRWREKRREWGETPCEVAYKVDFRKGGVVSQFSGNIHHPAALPLNDPRMVPYHKIAIRVLLGYWQPEPQHECVRAYQRVEHAAASRQGWFATLNNVGKVGRHNFYCLPPASVVSR